jgi:hypothetical protein
MPSSTPISVNAAAVTPRQEQRNAVPAIGVAIKADFLDCSQVHAGRLWDVSPSGACLWFPSLQRVGTAAPQVGVHGQVVIHHPSDPVTIPIPARLAWVDELARATYAGFEFLERTDFTTTFLRLVIRA